MELKVWVDGVVRVVCGLSEDTSCQDVVIALAQAIGQTGRYVLIQKLRDTERQLLAAERPLESLAKLGQHGSEVQFFLRRTGPSSSDGPAQDRGPPSLPKHAEPEPPKRREPKKSLTFNLGPSSSPRAKPKQPRQSPRDSPEPRAAPSPSPAGPSREEARGPGSREEVFRLVLQQQERLQALQAQLEALEHEEGRASPPETELGLLLPPREEQEELAALEEASRRNRAELAQERRWEEELEREAERERSMRRRVGELHARLDDCGRRLGEFAARSALLEQEIQRESLGLLGGAAAAPPGQAGPPVVGEESLGAARVELQSRQGHGAELEAELTETDRALGKAEVLLQAKQEELEDLNKELRQCNLQQFIQQTGVLPVQSYSRTDLREQLDPLELAHLLHDRQWNSGPVPRPAESPPRPTAKQFLGHPRNLQHPLVSSLNPEVLTSRESSWR